VLHRFSPSLIEIVLLALWLGAAAFLALVVAPSLFAVLPTRTLAGAVVGRILPPVFIAGIVVGAIVLGLQVAGRRAWAWHGREIAGTTLIAACAIAQFIIAPQINRLRAEIGGPLEDLAASDARRVAFGRLHGISVAWLGLAMLAAAAAMIIAARADGAADASTDLL
jgi:hypothetical protein